MLKTLTNYIKEQGLFTKKDKLLLAISGGKDSVLMLDLLCKAGFNVAVVHCNFSLRGKDSDEDELFVKELAEKYKVVFYTKRFDTQKIVLQEKKSVQLIARQLRYEYFEELCKNFDFTYVLTAHHKNDLSETMLYNLVRGTGLAGLRSILAKNRYLCRPMLCFTRQEIDEKVMTMALEWREDRSNASDKYRRNFIRHKVLPLLKEINPNLENTLSKNSQHFAAAENLLHHYLSEWKKNVFFDHKDYFYIPLEKLKNELELEYKLYFLLNNFGFNAEQVKEIAKNEKVGKLFIADNYELVIDRKNIIIAPIIPTLKPIFVEENVKEIAFYEQKMTFHLVQTSVFEATTIYLAKDKLHYPLLLRTWQSGDYILPFGMHGKQKKISDLLNDGKVPLPLKKKIPVLCNGNGDILYVLGFRSSEKYKVQPNEEALCIKLS